MGKFETGSKVLTRGVFEWAEESVSRMLFVAASIASHTVGDWGELCPEDIQSNEEALLDGNRLMSAYMYRPGTPEERKLWIITEWDRSVTTVLFPEEY